jgi:arylsulfatase A-like enzyme
MTNPNVVLITIDSLRYDFIYEGNEISPKLPGFEKLADESVEFHNAFANAPYTSDSFPSILGGTHAKRFPRIKGIEPQRPYLPKILHEKGYSTTAIHSNPNLSEDFGYARGVDHFWDADTSEDQDDSLLSSIRTHFTRNVPNDSALFKFAQWGHDVASSHFGKELGGMPYTDGNQIADEAISFATDASAPAFVWVQFMDVHSPFYPHPETVSQDIEKSTAVKTFNKVRNSPDTSTDVDIDLLKRAYQGEVEYLDKILGRMLERLDSELSGDTLIILTSDHGEAFGEHGRYFHTSGLYDENVHIPLLVRLPSNEDREVDTAVTNADILPTILNFLTEDVPDACDGSDLLTLDPQNKERTVISHSKGVEDGEVMVATSDWKMIRDLEQDSSKLFDRVNDPEERQNIIDDAPERGEKADQILRDYFASIKDNKTETSERSVGEDTEARLEALGYK